MKYGVREDINFAPWADTMRPGYLSLLGDDELGQTAVDMLASQLAPASYATYGTGLRSFLEFCREGGLAEPLEASAADIARYLAWLARRGTVAGGSLQPYLSSINTFFRDHLREPVALGPLISSMVRGYKQNQVALTEGPTRIYFPAAGALAILAWAETLLPFGRARLPELRAAAAVLVNYIFFARGSTGVLAYTSDLAVAASAIVFFQRHVKGRHAELVDRLPVVQVPSAAHRGRIAAVLRGYMAVRAAACAAAEAPVPDRLWQLPGEAVTAWTAATMTTWLQTCCAAAPADAPPAGFAYTSHSLRSGAAIAASAVLVPLPKIRHYGGWSAGSAVVETDYIDPSCVADAAARFFFGWLGQTPVVAS